ncbi:Uma2 family endonuclease [Spirulina sp. 06S082]|uniref:Uma2 family endonuclease n=1 Tax=Spirulina sp. 06S082 TaxID=3110248 RepID=UPI002B1F6238|nr:Uma2 family endonuclease [Spirulina sp. 06S082]MEA5467684.1 Uma2 family endonuclease [Spirulina sp. 06S082]
MTQAIAPPTITPQEYLDREINSENRHEYINGEIVPMTGGTPNHNKISLNFASSLNFALKRKPYQVFMADQRLWIGDRQIYTYPDIAIVKGELIYQEGRKDTIINPCLIAEVLSKSTRSYDKDEKFAAYRSLPSFCEYLLIDQYCFHVEQYSKTEAGKWLFCEYDGESASLSLTTIEFAIALADLYDKVNWDAP